MVYEVEIYLPPRLYPIWKVRLNEPFMAFGVGQFIDQPGGGPFKIEEVRHAFDIDEDRIPVHRIALVVLD